MKYHIRIESEADGGILDVETDAFVLIHNKSRSEHDISLSIRNRGLNPYELVGILDWAKASSMDWLLQDTEESDPLIDEQ